MQKKTSSSDIKQYHKLRAYAKTLLNVMPGGHVIIHVERVEDNVLLTFQRMFWCLNAMKHGFLAGCRLIVELDGCYLKSPFGGQLLAAIGRDNNDNMFPIALVVVELERFDNW